MAAFDCFLKLDGAPGESKDHKHKDEIEINSWGWGAVQGGSFGFGGGGGTGKVQIQDFHFSTKTSKASPKLMNCCMSGEHIKNGVLTVRKAGKEQQEYLSIKFTDILVSSFSSAGAGSGDPTPLDSFSLNFAKIEWGYKEQLATGALGGAVNAGYDQVQNKVV